MESRIKNKNIALSILLLVGLAGSVFEAYELSQIARVNHALRAGQPVENEGYPYQRKFAAAYIQGVNQDYKHAIQTYGQLLETAPITSEKARIQFNIGNNLFLTGLIRRLNDDGTLKDEAKYAFSQARLAYEQSLRFAPESQPAKFNLSLLHAVIPSNMKGTPKEQTGMELSNLPVGLP